MAAYMLLAGPSGYTDIWDGWSAPAGACVMVIEYDGHTGYTPPQGLLAPVPYDGRAVFVPAQPTPTLIPSLAFIRRFTSAEVAAITAADPTWAFQVAAAGTISVTDPTLLANAAAAVAAGLMTQARVNQVLNLAVASP